MKKAVESSDEEAEERVEEKEKNTHEKTKESAKSDDEEDDDDAPLSKMVASAKFPTDEELTCKVKELLKVADLNAVSMKVIRTNVRNSVVCRHFHEIRQKYIQILLVIFRSQITTMVSICPRRNSSSTMSLKR